MPPLFYENQQLDESEMVDFLANKAPRNHKTMLIYQGFDPETVDLEIFMELCERSESTDNISGAKFAASDAESDTKLNKKRPNFKERQEHGKKRHDKQYLLYCSLHDENKSHTTRECKVLKAKTKDKPNYYTDYYKRKSRELNLLEKEAAHQRAKYLKYKKLNKAFAKKKTCTEGTVILDDTSDSNSSLIREAQNSRD